MKPLEKIDFFDNLLPIKKQQYKQINNDRLIVYAVYILEKNGIEATFDSVVVTAFKSFPDRFSLIGFPHYPDAKRVHDCLWHCTYKTKKWLTGNAKSGFRLSEKGRHILAETFDRMEGKIRIGRVFDAKARRKEVFFVDWIKQTGAFQKYMSSEREKISEFEVREFLRVSNDSSKDIIRQNLEKYTEYARKIDDVLVKDFLKYVKRRWGMLFE
jgi:hypothetical protein